MSRRSKIARERKEMAASPSHGIAFADQGGFHVIAPGKAPNADELQLMTEKYQESIRKSPLWKQMVKQFGKDEAEKLLKECKAQLK